MKTFSGIVVSNTMQKTAVVEVVRRVPHPLYKKLMKKSTRFKVHTGDEKVEIGQRVVIVSTKPISKDKHFMLATLDKKKEQK